jgi:hypothetical protein
MACQPGTPEFFAICARSRTRLSLRLAAVICIPCVRCVLIWPKTSQYTRTQAYNHTIETLEMTQILGGNERLKAVFGEKQSEFQAT